MKFNYEAFDPAGKPVAGIVEAADANEAQESLRRQGLYVTGVSAGGDSRGAAAGGVPAGRRRLGKGRRMKNLAMFTRQLAVLVSSGTPLVDALGSLERQAKEPTWRGI